MSYQQQNQQKLYDQRQPYYDQQCQMSDMNQQPEIWNSPQDSGFNSRMSEGINDPSNFNAQQTCFNSQTSDLNSKNFEPTIVVHASGCNSQPSGFISQSSDFNTQSSGFSSQPSGFYPENSTYNCQTSGFQNSQSNSDYLSDQPSGHDSQQSGFISHQSGAQTPALSTFDNDSYMGMNYNEWEQQDEYANLIYNDQTSHQSSTSHMSTPYYQEPVNDEYMCDMTLMPGQSCGIDQINTFCDDNGNYNEFEDARHKVLGVISNLQDEDRENVGQALLFIRNDLLNSKVSKDIAIESQDLIIEIFKTIYRKLNENDMEIVKTAALVVNHISHDRKGIDAILNLDGIHILLDLLTSQCGVTQSHALTTFHNLVIHCKESKFDAYAIVHQANGIEKLVSLLQRDNIAFLTILTNCIQLLTYANPDAKKELLRCGGTLKLIAILRRYKDVRLLINTVRALKVLSVCEHNQIPIIKANGMETLCSYLDGQHQSSKLLLDCLLTIRNLSVNATVPKNIGENSARLLLKLLNGTNEGLVAIAAGGLSNLICNNDSNKAIICQVGGISTLIETIKRFYNKDEIVEPAIRALKNLTSGQRGLDVAQNTDFRLNLFIFIRLLERERKWQVASAALGLIRNLARRNTYSEPLRGNGAIPYLVHRLKMAEQESQAVVDSVRMNDIIQGTVGTLISLAESAHNRTIIRNSSVVPTFVRLLSNSAEFIHGPAIGLLYSLAVDAEGVQLIYRTPGAIQALKQMKTLQNGKIKAFAKNILHALAKVQQQESKHSVTNSFNNSTSSSGYNSLNSSSSSSHNYNFDNYEIHNQHWNDNGMNDINHSMDTIPLDPNVGNPLWNDTLDEESFLDSLNM